MRKRIFISHASPDDNDFTKWLALKLVGLGYDVWCDILKLEKAVDFWSSIEKEIRENTCKFLLVSSLNSNQREGVLKEIAVAAKVKKLLIDEKFILPLAIDEKLSYDDINIEIVRLNAIDFKSSWAIGLQDLIKFLEDEKVPKNEADLTKSNLLYQQIFLHDKGVLNKKEVYDSNWFPISEFPAELRFHDYDSSLPKNFDVRKLKYPALRFKQYVCTFAWEFDFMDDLPKTETYNNSKTVRFPVSEILSAEIDSNIIGGFEAQRLIVQLLNMAFERKMQDERFRKYEMSNKNGYWVEIDKLEKDKYEKVQLVGTQKDKKWHYGISGAGKLYPLPVLMISSHIYFTSDGKKIIDSTSIQHSARRKQSKNWWNNVWRQKLLGFFKYVANGEDNLTLEVGSEENILISTTPIQFNSEVSYNIPNNNNLEEEAEISEINDYDDDELTD